MTKERNRSKRWNEQSCSPKFELEVTSKFSIRKNCKKKNYETFRNINTDWMIDNIKA